MCDENAMGIVYVYVNVFTPGVKILHTYNKTYDTISCYNLSVTGTLCHTPIQYNEHVPIAWCPFRALTMGMSAL